MKRIQYYKNDYNPLKERKNKINIGKHVITSLKQMPIVKRMMNIDQSNKRTISGNNFGIVENKIKKYI